MIVYYFFNPFVTIKKPIYIFLIIKLYTEHVYTSIYNSTLEKTKKLLHAFSHRNERVNNYVSLCSFKAKGVWYIKHNLLSYFHIILK